MQQTSAAYKQTTAARINAAHKHTATRTHTNRQQQHAYMQQTAAAHKHLTEARVHAADKRITAANMQQQQTNIHQHAYMHQTNIQQQHA